MKWLELLNMEYGECVVLGGGDRSLLMVDCGSVSQKLREGDVPLDAWLETIAARYEPAMERWFLLTHFHRDHLSGFQKLLESREGYFSRVFLPRAPVDSHGVPLLLEYALFAYLFAQPQSDAFQVNTWCVKAFRTLEQRLGQDRIFTLGAGDSFHFDGVEYQVLWPRVESYPFEPELAAAVEALNVLFASPFQPGCVKRFLEKKEEFLADYVNDGGQNTDIRPNQIIACAMPYGMLSDIQKQKVIDKVRRHLLTPHGLRTLSPRNPMYHGHYTGDQPSRDRAYHQGTAWPWLLEHYVKANFDLYGKDFINEATEILQNFEEDISVSGIASINEIYDGDPPHNPRGAISQAWSVGAILRIDQMIKAYSKLK